MFDSQYIEALKKGNPSVQRELVDFFSGKMFSIARRYLADDHLAYDVLQESWIAIFNNIKTYKEEIAPIEAWIYRIVVNQSLKEIKKRKRNIEYVAEFTVEPEGMAPEVLDTLQLELLFNYVCELPEGCRAVFNMYVFDEFSHKEIALQLGINEGTSRSQLNRARKLLMEKINSMDHVLIKKYEAV